MDWIDAVGPHLSSPIGEEMRVGIVGSRERFFRDPAKAKEQVRKILDSLSPGDVVVTGDAPSGIDRYVRDEFKDGKSSHLKLVVKEAEWDLLGIKAGHLRNSKVIEDSEVIHVIWNGSSPGSYDVVQKVQWMQMTYGSRVLQQHVID